MADWNAELYSRFEKERTIPSYDLVRAVEGEPKTVLDIGCGIGNSTQVVAEHFPHFIHFRGFTPEISLIRSAAFWVFPYV